MCHATSNNWCAVSRFLSGVVPVVALLLVASAHAAAPGIKGTSFSLNAGPGYSTQPDGVQIYSWGYGCTTGFTPTFAPAAIGATAGAFCPTMQLPGPTLIVTQGVPFTVTLTNSLPGAAGNTSILFPGKTVTYTVTSPTAGTHAYYSGTQPDLQIEMGLFGAVIVLPSATPTNCAAT